MPKTTKTENSSTKKSAAKTVKSEPKAKAESKAEPKVAPAAEPKVDPAPVDAKATKKVATPKKSAKKETKKAVTKKTAKTTDKKATKKTVAKKSTKKTATKTTKAAKAPTKGGAKASAKSGGKKQKKDEPKADEGEGDSHSRYFKVVIGEDGPHGRFSGSKPKQAAAKALTSILRSREENGTSIEGQIKFSIVECTRGSRHKTYNYIGERVELDKPMEITIRKGDNAKVITYKYNNKVMKDKSA